MFFSNSDLLREIRLQVEQSTTLIINRSCGGAMIRSSPGKRFAPFIALTSAGVWVRVSPRKASVRDLIYAYAAGAPPPSAVKLVPRPVTMAPRIVKLVPRAVTMAPRVVKLVPRHLTRAPQAEKILAPAVKMAPRPEKVVPPAGNLGLARTLAASERDPKTCLINNYIHQTYCGPRSQILASFRWNRAGVQASLVAYMPTAGRRAIHNPNVPLTEKEKSK